MPHKEIRKIIKVGNSFAVTLPIAWLRYFKPSDKDHVQIVSNDKVIIQLKRKTK